MKNRYKVCLFIFLSFVLSQLVYSQKNYYIGIGDSIYNHIPAHRGTVQWQYSEDNGSSWYDFPGLRSKQDDFGASITCDLKIRAKVTEGTCSIYSDTTIVYTNLSDFDGNKYPIKKIGTQVWMTENLRTSHYSDGSVIPYITIKEEWSALKSDAYCYANDVKDSSVFYGYLYNGYAVKKNTICPKGWGVPTDTDWEQLSTYLIKNGYGFGGSGDDIAKSLSAVNLAAYTAVTWSNSDIEGAPGNNVKLNNSSGFNGLPVGYRDENGNYGGFGTYANWWANYLEVAGNLKSVAIYYDNPILPGFLTGTATPIFGSSIRCIKQ